MYGHAIPNFLGWVDYPSYGAAHPRVELCSLRASSPIWASEASLARLVSLAQIGELARRLGALLLCNSFKTKH